MRPALIALAIVVLAAPVEAAERLPTFPKRTPYEDARASLKGLGWEPIRLEGAATCEQEDERCTGRPEMFFCSGTGLARCVFTWRRRDQLVEVGTFGETSPMVDSVRCRAGC
ncbi:hypothetical protein [Methylobacterium sp. J-090]|uniref:hypothetical protein n=1 Tax=Methylobacterium sp. J-090 TaxID=2836666 RepID=UPI001FB9BEF2|nr:hypothetical protein [Methylobacterium sp. J-090]MCJ2082759.1 hypothetical protein [Methylobacterium sp. J-090]